MNNVLTWINIFYHTMPVVLPVLTVHHASLLIFFGIER
jgi:hypothetical protein